MTNLLAVASVATVLFARINNTVTLGYNPSTDTLSSFFFHSVN